MVPHEVTELLTGKVSAEMNESLTKPFSDKEVGDTLFQIGPLKAPGPDCFPARFFQRNWSTLKDEIVCAMQRFFADEVIPESCHRL